MGTELSFHNGRVRDGAGVCHECQKPEPDVQASDGEWYHHECVPEGL